MRTPIHRTITTIEHVSRHVVELVAYDDARPLEFAIARWASHVARVPVPFNPMASVPRRIPRLLMHIDGSCHCGSITFTAEIDPSRVMVCHCTDCQVLSGSPFRAVIAAPIESFVLKGQPKSYVKTAQSGSRRAQVFCPECGTPLYSSAPENPTSVTIRLGCVAQRARLEPAAQIWQHSALPWLAHLPDVPGSPEQQAFLPAIATGKPQG